MGNEMGNRNSNGLQVPEQEGDEVITKVINQSPNASLVSNDLDGLKGLTGYLTDSFQNSNKRENEKLVDTSQSILPRENEVASKKELAEKLAATYEQLNSSTVSNDPLDLDDFVKHEDNKFATDDEPSDSLIMPNEEHTDLAQYEFSETDDSVIQRQSPERRVSEEEINEASKTINVPPEALAAESPKDSPRCLPDNHQTSSDEQEDKKLDTDEYFEHIEVPNDKEERTQSTMEGEHHEQTYSACSDSLETDDALIQKQMPDERAEEEAKIWAQELLENVSDLEDSIVEGKNECIAANTNEAKGIIIEELPVEDIGSRETLLMSSSEVVGGSIDRDGDRQCSEVDIVHKDFGSLQWKDHMSNEPIDDTYLDAIDYEISKLVMDDDANGVNEESRTESNEYEDKSTKPLEEELKVDDIDTDSFEIQLRATDPCEEEKEEGEDGGVLEEAVFEICIQSDDNPNLMSKKEREDLDMEITIVTDISAEDKKNEEVMGYETGGLESNEITGEHFSQLSCLSDPDAEMVVETKNPNPEEKAFVSNALDLDVIGCAAERQSDQQDGEFDYQSEEAVAIVTKFDEHLVQIIATETTPPASSQHLEESEKERVPNEYETPTSTEVKSIQIDYAAVCVSETGPITSEGSERFPTKLSKEKFKTETDDNAPESVKCLIYTSESGDLEVKECSPSNITAQEYGAEEPNQIPSIGHDEASSFETEENLREYHVSTNQEVTSTVDTHTSVSALKATNEESEKSPLLSAIELTDSGKPRAPLSNLLKEEGIVVLKKTIKELWQSPAKTSMSRSARGREKQKQPRSSLFGSCICCTTAIN